MKPAAVSSPELVSPLELMFVLVSLRQNRLEVRLLQKTII